MRKRSKRTLGVVLAAVAALASTFLLSTPALAHGALMMPGSRTFLCYEDALQPNGQLIPHNPACAAAVAQSGTTPLYNWFAVLRSDGAGRTRGFIPDGKLCSADSPNYDFSGFDLARGDWPTTHLTAGSTIQIKFNKWAAHPGTWRLYTTKQGWDDTQPLTWDDLQDQPFSTVTDPPSVGDPGSIGSYWYWNATLPSGLSGHHIVYVVWQRSDSTETFYGCSDVDFDGGNGEVTGLGSGSVTPGTCTADYAITNSWSGGYQAQVTVTNTGTSPTSAWSATWMPADGETITQVWNGTLGRAGDMVTVRNADWNGALSPGASTTFGLVATTTAAPTAPMDVTCGSVT